MGLGLATNILFNAEYAFVSAGTLMSGRTGNTEGFNFYSSKPYQFPVYANQLAAGFVFELA